MSSQPSKTLQTSVANLLHLLASPALDDTGAPSLTLDFQLQAGLTWLLGQDDPDSAKLAGLLEGLLVRLAQDRLPSRIALQKAQFELQLLRQLQTAASNDTRLHGDAHALGVLLARAMGDLPRGPRKKLFSATEYLALNPDVAAAGLDPLDHYLSSGAEEGRAPKALRTQCPGSYPETEIETLIALIASEAPPRFSVDLPAALRDEALMLLGQKRPRVSVVMPTWNRAHTVLSAVTSALLQSYAPHELIIVDDGSTDGTADLLQARFPEPIAENRLIVIRQAQAGVSAARNTGLSRTSGDIIAYLDSDNQWEPDHLLFGVAGLLATPKAQSAYTALCRHNLSAGWSDILYQRYDRAALAQQNYIDLNSFLHRRSLYDTFGGFDTGLTRLVDWDLVLRYTAEFEPVALPVITGHHVIDNESLGNITMRESAEPNLARIRAKQQATAGKPR